MSNQDRVPNFRLKFRWDFKEETGELTVEGVRAFTSGGSIPLEADGRLESTDDENGKADLVFHPKPIQPQE